MSYINRIILNIAHSDDYTDYLFMTAALTDKRVVPMLEPDPEVVRRESDPNTMVLRCISKPTAGDRPVGISVSSGTVTILSRYYLLADGSVDATHADLARSQICEALKTILYYSGNLREAYRHHFPLLWSHRRQIYDNPQYFSAFCGRHIEELGGVECMPLGAALKAMDDDDDLFRLQLRGGCNCMEKPFLIDYCNGYATDTRGSWVLHTWCPSCQSRREIRAWDFQRAYSCDWAIETARRAYSRGQGMSHLSLFDVIDALRSA